MAGLSFNWISNFVNGTQVIDLVLEPQITAIPVDPVTRVEWASYEAMGKHLAAEMEAKSPVEDIWVRTYAPR